MSVSERPTEIVYRELRDPKRTPLQILCIEDNEGDFGLIRAYLKDAAFSAPIQVHRARTMAETLQLFTSDGKPPGYDIVLMDLSLPDSIGKETYDQLRTVAPSIAVAILSGNNDTALALDLVQHGAQDYLPKDNLTPDLLMRCITYAMKRQRHRVAMENLTSRLRRTTEELKTTQMQLIQAEKIESLGRLTSSIAHEVKNPLSIIQIGLDFLKDELAQAGGNIESTLGLMAEAVGRADAVIHDMLNFSRKQDIEMKSCDANEIVHYVARIVKHEIDRHGIKFVTELASPLPRVQCDANGIGQVLINVMMNALQAMERGGHLTVRTHSSRATTETPRDPGLREMNFIRVGDPVVIIDVQDEGPGIPDHIMGRVFEPFFTTKPTGEGTGLGLSVCRRIVELHRGQLLIANVDAPRGLRVSIVLKAESAA